MAANAGYLSRLFVTTTDTNPTTSDLIGGVQNASWNAVRAELDTSALTDTFTKAIQGQSSNKPTIATLFDSTDTGQGRLITAFGSGATVYLHYDPTGSGACLKVGVKCFGYSPKSAPNAPVTADYTISAVTAMGTSTVS
jgi:hypothetical protein